MNIISGLAESQPRSFFAFIYFFIKAKRCRLFVFVVPVYI